MVKLPPITIADITNKLLSSGTLDARLAQQAARLSEGSYPEALRLLNDVANDLFPQTRNWFNMIFTNNGIGLSKFVEDFAKMGREQQKNMLQYVIHLLEATIHHRYTNSCNLIDDELSFVQKLAKTTISFESLETMIREIAATMYHIERNAHAKMQVHALSIKMVYAIQNKQVSSLIN
jgi:DNA polymerase-3 subunit delta'